MEHSIASWAAAGLLVVGCSLVALACSAGGDPAAPNPAPVAASPRATRPELDRARARDDVSRLTTAVDALCEEVRALADELRATRAAIELQRDVATLDPGAAAPGVPRIADSRERLIAWTTIDTRSKRRRELFGLSDAEILRRFGEPDSVEAGGNDGVVTWSYKLPPDPAPPADAIGPWEIRISVHDGRVIQVRDPFPH